MRGFLFAPNIFRSERNPVTGYQRNPNRGIRIDPAQRKN